MKYRLLGPALDDLDSIEAWVLANFGEAAADRARQRLFDTFATLADFQYMGIERRDITGRPMRFFSLRPNWIVYEPGEPMLIHRIYPAALDLKTINLDL